PVFHVAVDASAPARGAASLLRGVEGSGAKHSGLRHTPTAWKLRAAPLGARSEAKPFAPSEHGRYAAETGALTEWTVVAKELAGPSMLRGEPTMERGRELSRRE